ncbi:MAG: Crp/Fnr family transcriptional regulator [Nitrospirae bacterium]|nr:Crp/Fnr family transcriptional regulator [Nitrospirota bacterium]MBI5695805.1 Crp/Fnr family transcriptional regulator [Nitrospirota bacterium]
MGAEQKLFERYGRTIPAGTLIFRENEPGQDMYIIQGGSVKITKRVRDIEKTLVVLDKGEFFGEMSILNDKPRSASAYAVEDCDLLVIDRRTFEAMIKGNPEIALRIIKKLAARLQEADHQIENLMIKDNTGRVVNHIARLVNTAGGARGTMVELGVTEEDIANMVGIPRDQVEAILAKLAKAKMVDLSTGRLVVADAEQLGRFTRYLDMKDSFGELM